MWVLLVLTQHSCLPHHETTDCCFITQAATSWCICRVISSTVSTPGSRRSPASPSSSLVTHTFRLKKKTENPSLFETQFENSFCVFAHGDIKVTRWTWACGVSRLQSACCRRTTSLLVVCWTWLLDGFTRRSWAPRTCCRYCDRTLGPGENASVFSSL